MDTPAWTPFCRRLVVLQGRRLLFTVVLLVVAAAVAWPLKAKLGKKRKSRRTSEIAQTSPASSPPSTSAYIPPTVSYTEQIKPLLESKCTFCHGSGRQAAKL